MSRLRDHYGLEEFLERIAAANDASDLTDNDLDFLSSIESKYDRWGDEMFFSDAQADYLEALAARGEDVFDGDDDCEREIIYVGKRRGKV
jgi:hypothetical protein